MFSAIVSIVLLFLAQDTQPEQPPPPTPEPSCVFASDIPVPAERREELLECAGWAPEVRAAAMRVVHGESGWRPWVTNGHVVGLFQLSARTWSRYCGVPVEVLYTALGNARCAWHVYQYDVVRGQPWAQWEVKP